MTLLITYVLIALGFSFLCSLLEATLLSITPATIQTAKANGERWARKMEVLKGDIDKPLSAILTLNTIAHTMGAAGAGAQYARIYGNATEAVFAAALTLAILVFTEIIPKTLGARYSLFFAKPTAWFLPFLQTVLAPLVWVAGKITSLITLGKAEPLPMHREELIATAQIAERAGSLKSEEGAVVKNILRLHETRVTDIMTPRPVLFTLPESTLLAEFPALVAKTPFSRIPLYGENRDDITGFVLRAEALLAQLQEPEEGKTLAALKRPIQVVPEHISADRLFDTFLESGQHIMLVANEFGSTAGLVTLEDVLETIVGFEIVDEKDEVADLQSLARELWRNRARRMGLEIHSDSDAGKDAEADPEAKPGSGAGAGAGGRVADKPGSVGARAAAAGRTSRVAQEEKPGT